MTTIRGFYRCPSCRRLHAFSGGFLKVHCPCGLVIDQLKVAQGSVERPS